MSIPVDFINSTESITIKTSLHAQINLWNNYLYKKNKLLLYRVILSLSWLMITRNQISTVHFIFPDFVNHRRPVSVWLRGFLQTWSVHSREDIFLSFFSSLKLLFIYLSILLFSSRAHRSHSWTDHVDLSGQPLTSGKSRIFIRG